MISTPGSESPDTCTRTQALLPGFCAGKPGGKAAALVALGVAIPDRRSANNSAKYHSTATGSANSTYILAWKAGRAAERGALSSLGGLEVGLGLRPGEKCKP